MIVPHLQHTTHAKNVATRCSTSDTSKEQTTRVLAGACLTGWKSTCYSAPLQNWRFFSFPARSSLGILSTSTPPKSNDRFGLNSPYRPIKPEDNENVLA